MKKIKLLIVLLVVLQTSITHAQKVSNIVFRQEQSNIIVSYNLETKIPCKITLFVSTNDGNTWTGPLTKVTGDVGVNIASGIHNIIWSVLEEFEELRGDKIQFQVRAYMDAETIVIGTQEWTGKNLDVSTYSDGSVIPKVTDPTQWYNLTTGAWCYYNNDPANGATFGKLYNWYAVAGIWNEASKTDASQRKKLAPTGYHVPSFSEWTTLTTYLGGDVVAGGKMKSTILWSPNTEATNTSGFNGLPAGYRYYDGTFGDIGNNGYWWSSSEDSTTNSWYRNLYYYNGTAYRNYYDKIYGFSVRCLRD